MSKSYTVKRSRKWSRRDLDFRHCSSPCNHDVFILAYIVIIIYRHHHLDITMSAKRIATEKEDHFSKCSQENILEKQFLMVSTLCLAYAHGYKWSQAIARLSIHRSVWIKKKSTGQQVFIHF